MAGTPVNADSAAPAGKGGAGDVAGGAMEGLTSVTKGISGILEGIMSVISKLFNAIMDASPLLQGVLKIVSKMFNLVLMPIGNAIGRLLLPIVVKMARQTAAFLSKYGNVGPDKIGDVLTEGLTMAFSSMIDMIAVIMNKVLWPVLTALGQSIINGFIYAISGGLAGSNKAQESNDAQFQEMIGGTFKDMMGGAALGAATVIDQFGMTIQTGNRIAGNSFAESATVFYNGNMDIANGFQATAQVLVIGTTKAIDKFATEFNLAGTELVTIIDTLQTPFANLKEWIDIAFPTKEKPAGGGGPSGRPTPLPVVGNVHTANIRAKEALAGRDPEFLAYMQNRSEIAKWDAAHRTASGGIVTRPTRILAGEAGPEAIIPLSKGGGVGSNTININFNGDVYGMNDFESKVEKAVGKYSGKVRGAI